MELIEDVKNLAHSRYRLPLEDRGKFRGLFNPSVWISSPLFNLKSVPVSTFELAALMDKSDLDSIQDKNLDASFIGWVEEFLKKHASTFIGLKRYTISGVTVWNGSAGNEWHSDNDGRDRFTDDFTILIYHIPIALEKKDGGIISFRDKSTGLEVSFLPADFDVIVMDLSKSNIQHKTTPFHSFEKDRYTLSVGVRLL